MKRSRFILLVGLGVAALALSFLLQRRAEATIWQNKDSLREQQAEIERVMAERHLVADVQADQTTTGNAGITNYAAELEELRARAATLRSQGIQLSNDQRKTRLAVGVRTLSLGNSNLLEQNKPLASTVGGGPRAENGKLNDGRAFAAALREYAEEHDGKFPSALDQVTAFLPKPLTNDSPGWANAPVSGTNDFEIVFQGGTNDLGNIPPRRVALLRERQPWLTPDGKWARTYAYADGAAEIVVSDDNFQSWDAVHVVPPPANP